MNPLQTLSIVVPAHNEAASLPHLAEALPQVKERSPENTPTNLLMKNQTLLYPFLLVTACILVYFPILGNDFYV